MTIFEIQSVYNALATLVCAEWYDGISRIDIINNLYRAINLSFLPFFLTSIFFYN